MLTHEYLADRYRDDQTTANPGPPCVGDTGIEPVTPTVSTFSIQRWLGWLPTKPPNSMAGECLLKWVIHLTAGCATRLQLI